MSKYYSFDQHTVRSNRSVAMTEDFDVTISVTAPLRIDLESLQGQLSENQDDGLPEMINKTQEAAREQLLSMVAKAVSEKTDDEEMLESLIASCEEGEEETFTVTVTGSQKGLSCRVYATEEVIDAAEREFNPERIALELAGGISHRISLSLLELAFADAKPAGDPGIDVTVSPCS